MKTKLLFYFFFCLLLLFTSQLSAQKPPNAGCNNNGNDCFLNASIQAIFHTIPLRNFLKANRTNYPDDSIPTLLCEHLEKMEKSTGSLSYEEISNFRKRIIHTQAPENIQAMRVGQHDAHEFLAMYLLNEIKTKTKNHLEVEKIIEALITENAPENKKESLRKLAVTIRQNFMDIQLENGQTKESIQQWLLNAIKLNKQEDLKQQFLSVFPTQAKDKTLSQDLINQYIQELTAEENTKKQELTKAQEIIKTQELALNTTQENLKKVQKLLKAQSKDLKETQEKINTLELTLKNQTIALQEAQKGIDAPELALKKIKLFKEILANATFVNEQTKESLTAWFNKKKAEINLNEEKEEDEEFFSFIPVPEIKLTSDQIKNFKNSLKKIADQEESPGKFTYIQKLLNDDGISAENIIKAILLISRWDLLVNQTRSFGDVQEKIWNAVTSNNQNVLNLINTILQKWPNNSNFYRAMFDLKKNKNKLFNLQDEDYNSLTAKIYDNKKIPEDTWNNLLKNQGLAKTYQEAFAKIFAARNNNILAPVKITEIKQWQQLTKLQDLYIETTPQILIVAIARFINATTRNDTNIVFPFKLNMAQHSENQERAIYNLYAIIMQSGSLSSGHYYTYAKWGQNWYEYNDNVVTPKNIAEMQQIAKQEQEAGYPYLLFYEYDQAASANQDPTEIQKETNSEKEEETFVNTHNEPEQKTERLPLITNALNVLKNALVQFTSSLNETKKNLLRK